MKRKIINFIIDAYLITTVFAITDIMMIKVFHSESIWLELGIYIVFYGIVFGTKSGIKYLWKNKLRKEQKMIKKLYDKSEIWFSVIWIIAYCALASIGDNLSDALGISKVITLPILLTLSVVLFLFIKGNNLTEKYGLCKTDVTASKMLFYIPVIILLTANMWYGFKLNMSPFESILYILSMLCVGFLEELIFRGLLFNAMLKNGKNSAIIVSSVTFGIGHIINLINGSGAELLTNLLQVIYAIAVGFMFVMIYYRTKSLLSCIITHGVFNALSAFANETGITAKEQIVSCLLITLISGAYAVYIAFEIKKEIK